MAASRDSTILDIYLYVLCKIWLSAFCSVGCADDEGYERVRDSS